MLDQGIQQGSHVINKPSIQGVVVCGLTVMHEHYRGDWALEVTCGYES